MTDRWCAVAAAMAMAWCGRSLVRRRDARFASSRLASLVVAVNGLLALPDRLLRPIAAANRLL
jgi:hypothetical protein